jgi:hypothetical protein
MAQPVSQPAVYANGLKEAGRLPGPVWTGTKYLAPHRDSIPGLSIL